MVENISTSLGMQGFTLAQYHLPNSSDLQFLSVLSGRIQIEENVLKAFPVLLAKHVNPVLQTHVENVRIFRVRSKKMNYGRMRHVVYYHGAIFCDCKRFYQFGHYCKHAFCLIETGLIGFAASLAIDDSYCRGGSIPSVVIVTKPSVSPLGISESWNWACGKRSEPDLSLTVVTVNTEEQEESSKGESETQARSQKLHSLAAIANSHSQVAEAVDDFVQKLQPLLNGLSLDRNPVSVKRQVVSLLNKSKNY